MFVGIRWRSTTLFPGYSRASLLEPVNHGVAVLKASRVVQSAGPTCVSHSVPPEFWRWGDGLRITRSFEILSAIPSRMTVIVWVATITVGNGPLALEWTLWLPMASPRLVLSRSSDWVADSRCTNKNSPCMMSVLNLRTRLSKSPLHPAWVAVSRLSPNCMRDLFLAKRLFGLTRTIGLGLIVPIFSKLKGDVGRVRTICNGMRPVAWCTIVLYAYINTCENLSQYWWSS